MKKVVAALMVIVAAGWSVAALTVRGMGKVAAAREWPMGLGALEDVPRQYPPRATNAAAGEAERLAQKGDVAALRAHLLTAGPLVWEIDVERRTSPSVRTLLAAARRLSARAKHSGDWDDLRALWALAKPLWQRPELECVIAATALTRGIVDTAAVLPRPVPAWFAEVRTTDYRRETLRSMQFDTWRLGTIIDDHAKTQGLAGPYWRLTAADMRRLQRDIAWAHANGHTASMTAAWWNRAARMVMVDSDSTWQSVVQLEADAKAIV